ncbi:myosin class II heavy chain (MHC) [Apiospora hydei]|uniref:Myosin class II heavy chain (MHC) n=1 Tax=Apiospora hydei TaxID=1337664 RepID=A0ABR1VMC5_9PEZI
MFDGLGTPKTSSPRPSTPPGASAQDGIAASRSRTPSSPRSPAFSTSSTVDGSDDQQSSSPIIPSLPAPRLPERAQEHLRRATSPQSRTGSDDDNNYVTTSWGSPYPHSEGKHLRQTSSSSEASDDSPIHHLEIQTPFLRTVPLIAPPDQDHHQTSQLSESAAILVNRVRRPVRSITEDWIRAHTTRNLTSEQRHWLSDEDYSEHSSLSGSVSSDEVGWFEETDPRTPRASSLFPGKSHGHPRTRSSNETLRQATLNLANLDMDNLNVETGRRAQDAASIHTIESDTTSKMETPRLDRMASVNGSMRDAQLPATPSRPMKPGTSHTPRLKKKVPWKGKSIVVHLPRDSERFQPGSKGLKTLSSSDIEAMYESWEELGYNTRGFDLDAPRGNLDPLETSSQSRNEWPNLGDIARERSQRKYQVTLPDLNAWKNYVNEIAEAKLRALGVSFGDEDPAPSISPVPSNLSRQTSGQYPPLPFSPPIPTLSAGSGGPPGFPFPGAFQPTSAAQSPSLVSHSPFNAPGKYNPRASIAISPNELPFFNGQPSPHGWSPHQMLLHNQHLGRSRSPTVMNMSSVVSPTSPFQHEGIPSPLGLHQRHQSLQFPMLPHQFLQRQDSARASPRLQELREVDEEVQVNPYDGQGPEKAPEPSAPFIKHNASASLQKEIDDAEYHLEEQFREQLEHEDYSPHNENQKVEAATTEPAEALPIHSRGPSVHFGNFGTDPAEGPVLHHPRPHSRGHSLTQKAYFDNDEVRDSTDEGSIKKLPAINAHKGDESYEVETNPSNMGTPIQSFDLVNQLHQRDFSTSNNPWADAVSQNGANPSSRRPSHASKPSLSSLNANAAEFKFNPGSSNFTTGGFNFGAPSFQPGASSFQPMSFHGSQASVKAPHSATSSHFNIPQSAASSHFSAAPSTASAKTKITAAAPTFTPQQSDFSFPAKSDFNFSSSGPKFNPDAPTFQPFGSSFAPSITSATASGNESSSNRPTSIFGKIDLSLSDIVKPPAKKNKAIPIIRPSSSHSTAPAPVVSVETDHDEQAEEEQAEGGRTDKGRRSKNFRDSGDDGNDVPLFAEPTPEPEIPVAQLRPAVGKPEGTAQQEVDEDEDDDAAALADTSMASTVLSESNDGKFQSETNDTKATTSPTATSPDHDKVNWNAFEFSRQEEAQEFANARPFDDEDPSFTKTHKKSLSATAQPFTPGFMFGAPNPAAPAFEPSFKTQPAPMVESEASDDDRAASPTPMPEPRPTTEDVPEPEGEMRSPPSPETSPRTARGGLGASRFASSGLGASRFASPPPKPAGLAASRFAKSPSPVSDEETEAVEADGEPPELHSFNDSIPMPVSPPSVAADEPVEKEEPTFEEIDAVMRHLHDNDPTMGVNKTIESPRWHNPSPVRNIPLDGVANDTPLLLPPQQKSFRDNAPSPSPRQYRALPAEPAQPMLSTEMDDPFIDEPTSTVIRSFDAENPAIHHLNGGTSPQSDWEGDFSASEQDKLEQRVQFFDGHVNDVVDNVLASRLHPLEQALESIQHALISRRAPSSRRDRRSVSQELQESDADDEDDEIPVARRSMSPKRDKRVEQIRFAVLDAMKQHQALQAAPAEKTESSLAFDGSSIIQALSDMRVHFEQSLLSDFRSDELRNLEQRLQTEEEKVEKETTLRRGVEDQAAELRRNLEQAETKCMVEVMNRGVYDQRSNDLEERLKIQEEKAESEVKVRREAEDRLSEIQRLLRISSEEEDRLRAVVEEKEAKIKTVEHDAGNNAMRVHLLEAAQSNGNQNQAELTNRLNIQEEELRGSRQEARHWRSEAEHARESIRRQTDDLVHAVDESRHLRKLLDTMGTQVQEYERTRESWRAKYASLQDDLAHTVREMTEENMRHVAKEQHLLARHEVLDARLQAESRTRERLEAELERLEGGERAALRAVSECKRLEAVLLELRNENHKVHQNAMRVQLEAQQAKETAAAEVQRAQVTVQTELEAANEQVNIVRAELEGELAAIRAELEQAKTGVDHAKAEHESLFVEAKAQQEMMLEEEANKLRAELDQVKLDADTAKAHHEMMLEEATNSKDTALQELMRKHQNEVEDLQARYERQVNNTTEDAQRTEQHLLERLSLSTSKVEHLQDRVSHLEDKVQIAQEAARAAAQAAKAAGAIEPATHAAALGKPAVSQAMQLPEKISPQALRESIMVLQEQLQSREQRIEELEHTVSKLDPEAPTKITKRDDEITWLRELLAVRHGDLQDIIGALSADTLDREAVKDAAIRLKAGLQMEEQERERAMNGGSAINLPNIAATIQAATPRVAQAVGPLAAAWGNWRKGNTPSASHASRMRPSPAPARNSTPSKSTIASPASQNSFLSGLMTPPASGLRSTPATEPSKAQPTAFGNTGRRFTAEQYAQRSRGPSMTARQAEKMPLAVSPPPRHMADLERPVTPPMARSGGYDADASRIEDDFDDAGFFDD